jgi:hypothetical protein
MSLSLTVWSTGLDNLPAYLLYDLGIVPAADLHGAGDIAGIHRSMSV